MQVGLVNPNITSMSGVNPSSDIQDDINQLIQDLMSMMLPGNQNYAIGKLEADIAKLEKDLPNSNLSPDQKAYINQAISDAQTAIREYQNNGTIDLNTLINAMAEFSTPLASSNCPNDPDKLAALKLSLVVLYSSEMDEGIMYGYEPNPNGGAPVLTYFSPTQSEKNEISASIQTAFGLLQNLSADFPGIQNLINQLGSAIASGSYAQIATDANALLDFLAS